MAYAKSTTEGHVRANRGMAERRAELAPGETTGVCNCLQGGWDYGQGQGQPAQRKQVIFEPNLRASLNRGRSPSLNPGPGYTFITSMSS